MRLVCAPAIWLGFGRDHVNERESLLSYPVFMASSDSEEEFERGVEHLESGDFEAAIRSFGRCLDLDPTSAEAFGNRGIAKARSGDLRGAHSDFDAALRHAPESAFAWQHRANVLGEMGRHLEALSDYAEAIRLDPDEPKHLVNRATSLAPLGRAQEALDDFSRALELDPLATVALARRADLWADLGEYERACADLQRALEIEPEDPDLRCALGRARTLGGDLFGALDVLNEALKRSPEHAPTYAARGIVLSDLGRYEEAVADQTTALQFADGFGDEGDPGPYLATILNSRAISLRQAGQIEAALADFDRVIELDPTRALYRHNRGLAHGDQDFPSSDLELARRDQEHALRLEPDHVEARLELGRLHLAADELEPALAAFDRVCRVAPDFAEAHSARGEALEALGQSAPAIQAYSQAIRLDPGNPFHFLSRGQAHERSREISLSLDDFTHAIALSEGTFASAFSSRGVAKYNSDDLQGALADYSRAIELEPDEPIYWRNRAEVWEDLGDERKAAADEEEAERLERTQGI